MRASKCPSLLQKVLKMNLSSGKLQFWEWEKNLLVPEHFALALAGILHSSMPKISEEGLTLCILWSTKPGNCGLGVSVKISYPVISYQDVTSIVHRKSSETSVTTGKARYLWVCIRGLQFYTFFGISIGITRRMIDIGKKITFYFLQNVWKCTVFFAFAF